MAGPWDKYKKDEKKSDGPWNKFKGTPSSPGAILPTPSEPMDVDVKNLQSAFGFIPATALGSASDLSLGYAERVFTPKMKEYIKDNPEAYNVGGPALSMAVLSPLSAIGKAKGAYDATKPLKLLDNASVLERIMGNKVGKDVVTGAATGGAIGFAADPGEGKFSDIPERLKNMVSGGAIGSILKPIIGKGARVQDDVDLVKNPTKIFDESKRMKKEYVNQLNQDVISPLDQRARSLLADKKAVLDLDQYPEIADTAENIKLKSQGGFGMGSPRAEVGGEDILALRKALDKEANFDISKPTDVTSYAKRESAAAKAASLRKKLFKFILAHRIALSSLGLWLWGRRTSSALSIHFFSH